MCGFAGIFRTDPASPPPDGELVRRMRDTLRHRGPDDAGTYLAPGVGLGFRRLSIIDLEGGHQPMSNEDGTVWLVFNGEIYNFKELRRELESRGHTFRTRTDSEVILHLYEERSSDCVHQLRGMFAFALYDRRTHSLLLARDRLGIKPLYYRIDGDRVLFASEPKAILAALSPAERRPDLRALALYFPLLYVPDSACAFEGLTRLAPAHRLVLGADRTGPERYWEPRMPDDRPVDLADAARRVREILTEAVRMRMVADVPLGAFLSGGLDSAAVVGIMSGLADRPVRTFTIGFREHGFDETAPARATARFHGTDHHEMTVAPDAAELLETLVGVYDEPFGDPSAIPTYLVSRFAREHVTVVMSGDGGDELFAGYHRYRRLRMLDSLRYVPSAMRTAAAWAIGRGADPPSAGRLGRVLRRSLERFPDDYFSAETFLVPEMRRAVAPILEASGAYEATEPARDLYRAHAREGEPLAAAQLIDLEVYLPGDILTKVDRASMACSLEARVPLLDHLLVEAANALPTELKFDGRRGKKVLREACADLYPLEIVDRRKTGFGVPLGVWFRGPLHDMLRDHLLGPTCRQRGYYDPRSVEALLVEHEGGRRDRSLMLYGLLMFELWTRAVENVPA